VKIQKVPRGCGKAKGKWFPFCNRGRSGIFAAENRLKFAKKVKKGIDKRSRLWYDI
jgi:hypothetical protein